MPRLPRSMTQRQANTSRSMLPGSAGGHTNVVAPEPRPLTQPGNGSPVEPSWVKLIANNITVGTGFAGQLVDPLDFSDGLDGFGNVLAALPYWISDAGSGQFWLASGVYAITATGYYQLTLSSPAGKFIQLSQSVNTPTGAYTGATLTIPTSATDSQKLEVSSTLNMHIPAGISTADNARLYLAHVRHSDSSSLDMDVEITFERLTL